MSTATAATASGNPNVIAHAATRAATRVPSAVTTSDNAAAPSDTPLWSLVVWGGFGLAMALTAWGLWRMEVNPTWKAYLMVSWLYLISSAFTLAKTLRDAYEADCLERALRPESAPTVAVKADVPAATR